MDIIPESVDCSIYAFKAAAPKVAVVNVEYQGEGRNPYFKNFAIGGVTLPITRQEPNLLAA